MAEAVGYEMDRETGRLISGWESTAQSILVILSTRFHELIMLRWFGSFVPHLLGDNFTPRVIIRVFWAISTAIELWEPRFRVRQVSIVNAANTDEIRQGHVVFKIEGVYRPRGHLGDFTPESPKTYFIAWDNGIWERVIR